MQTDLAEQRFQEIYRQHQRHVLGYFLRRTDATSARDGAAEAFLVAWRRIEDVPAGQSTLPWLYGVSRRVLANQRRSRDRHTALGRKLTGIGAPDEPSPEVVVLRRAEEGEMLDAVGKLRPEDQEILLLTVWEELPHAQVAEVVGTSAHAIAQRLHRITRQLARDLRRPVHHFGEGDSG
ncbi:MAG: sigma-70 family RNA polymerase sigma factor [Acidimicrobiia bacterium]|nr:sigma-70 family RNA polymerase sigma factor [Acidimicrobiia bacterium]